MCNYWRFSLQTILLSICHYQYRHHHHYFYHHHSDGAHSGQRALTQRLLTEKVEVIKCFSGTVMHLVKFGMLDVQWFMSPDSLRTNTLQVVGNTFEFTWIPLRT